METKTIKKAGLLSCWRKFATCANNEIPSRSRGFATRSPDGDKPISTF